MEETAKKDPNNKAADIPDEEEEVCKPPANKRPRRKAALKSEELTAVLAKEDKNDDDDDDDVKKKPPRRKAAKKSSKQNNDDYEEEEEEGDEDSKPVANKRSRGSSLKKMSESTSTSRSSSAPIPLDAMVTVMEMLPPRSLYNTALTCKSLRQMVTTKMVVSSALIHGGNAKKTMEELYALMSNHSMHVPSPLRLLRLANGKIVNFVLLPRPIMSDRVLVHSPVGIVLCLDPTIDGIAMVDTIGIRKVTVVMLNLPRHGRQVGHDMVRNDPYIIPSCIIHVLPRRATVAIITFGLDIVLMLVVRVLDPWRFGMMLIIYVNTMTN